MTSHLPHPTLHVEFASLPMDERKAAHAQWRKNGAPINARVCWTYRETKTQERVCVTARDDDLLKHTLAVLVETEERLARHLGHVQSSYDGEWWVPEYVAEAPYHRLDPRRPYYP